MIFMKKRAFSLLLALAMAVSLTACGGSDQGGQSQAASAPQDSTSASQSAPADQGPEAYQFVTGSGASIAVNANMADVLAAIGEPQSYFEAESCAFVGMDKTYTYAGFTITTRPEEDQDLINSILLTDDSVTTAEGIYIGSSLADVIAAYGEVEAVGTLLSYTKGDCSLNFILDGDTVFSIEYLPA